MNKKHNKFSFNKNKTKRKGQQQKFLFILKKKDHKCLFYLV